MGFRERVSVALGVGVVLATLLAWHWHRPRAPLPPLQDDPASPVVRFTADRWQSKVLDSSRPVLVEFGATWCPDCREEAPILGQVARAVGGAALVGQVDIDREPALARRYEVSEIPALMVFRHGQRGRVLLGHASAEALGAALREAR